MHELNVNAAPGETEQGAAQCLLKEENQTHGRLPHWAVPHTGKLNLSGTDSETHNHAMT
jgi:hypothetical protein